MAEMTVRNFVIDSLHKFFVKIMQSINSASPWKLGTGSPSAHLGSSLASGTYSVAEGHMTSAIGDRSHAEGDSTIASGVTSHAEGFGTSALTAYTHCEGYYAIASGETSHAEGYMTRAIGAYSHAEGDTTKARGYFSHAEGHNTIASGVTSHAEGNMTSAIAAYSHAEGDSTTASGEASHAEGYMTSAIGDDSHAEGESTIASGVTSHAEGFGTSALTSGSHCEGYYTIATNPYEHAQGKYNLSHSGSTTATKTIHSIGYGTDANSRKNLVEVMQNGNVYIQGVGGYTGTATANTLTLQSAVAPYNIDLWEAEPLISNVYNASKNGKRRVVITPYESDGPSIPLSYANYIDEGEGEGKLIFDYYDPIDCCLRGYYSFAAYDDEESVVTDYGTNYFNHPVFFTVRDETNPDGSVHMDGSLDLYWGSYHYTGTINGPLTITLVKPSTPQHPAENALSYMSIIRLRTSTTPNITIQVSGNACSIKYYDGFSFAANTDYEIYVFYNGYEFIVSQAILT